MIIATIGLVSAEDDFTGLVEPHRRELRLHCYRMLGSLHDAEEVLQDTLLRAWKGRAGLGDPSRVRSWLYRIATNVCLDALANRSSRLLVAHEAPADPTLPVGPALNDEAWIEPAPASWLADPSEHFSRRERVSLAFVATLQLLTPVQRAVLLLREVVELSAAETADALDMNVGAVKSALFRAREALPAELPNEFPGDATLLGKYVRAFEQNDLPALVALLRDDIRTTMPPSPTWINGRDANEEFYRRMFAALARGAVRLVPAGANGQPAFGFYRATNGEAYRLRAIHVLTIASGLVAAIDHFMMPKLGPLFGLRDVL